MIERRAPALSSAPGDQSGDLLIHFAAFGHNYLMAKTPSPTALSSVGGWLDDRSPHAVVGASLVMVFALGLIDYASGPDVAFSIFYLVPVSLAGWKFRLRAACAIAGLSAVAWLVADLAAAPAYSSWWIPAWNTIARFAVFLVVVSLIQGLRNALREQEALARTDPLTGVLNARAFSERATEAISEAERRRRPLSFVYIDIDDFKTINDALGHSGGDRVLLAVGSALQDVTRGTDVVGRLGGDEFALIMPATGSEDAKLVLTNLMRRVYARLDGFGERVSFSAGGATFLTAPDSPDDMINAADSLMYEAKRAGKSTFRHVTIGGEMPSAADDQSARRLAGVSSNGAVPERERVVDLR